MDCVRWTDSIFNADELELDPATYRPYYSASSVELLKGFDEIVAIAKQRLEGAGQIDLRHNDKRRH